MTDTKSTKSIPVSTEFLNIENLPSHTNLIISKNTTAVDIISINMDIPLSAQSHGMGIIENGRRRNSM
jgi:hypothetical protein